MPSVEKFDALPLNSLCPYEWNAKEHTPEQVRHIANSIERFGWQQPIVADEKNTILAGHGRYLAAKSLQLASVPVWKITGLSEDEKRAYRLTDNKLNLDTGFDLDALSVELGKLKGADIDLDALSLNFNLDAGAASAARALDVDTTREKLESYLNATVKPVVLYFEHDEFDVLLQRLEQLRERHRLSDNSSLLLLFLHRAGFEVP